MIIYLGYILLYISCDLPGVIGRANQLLLDLAPDRVYQVNMSPCCWCALTVTFSPLPVIVYNPSAVYFLLHFPSAHTAWKLSSILPYGVPIFLKIDHAFFYKSKLCCLAFNLAIIRSTLPCQISIDNTAYNERKLALFLYHRSFNEWLGLEPNFFNF